MADSFTGDTITTNTNKTLTPVAFSGNTTRNTFIESKNIDTTKNISGEPVINEPRSKGYNNKISYTPDQFSGKKVIEKPTFTVKKLDEAFEAVKGTAFNNKNFFGDLIPEGDLTILFGKSNTGKSMLGYQFAEAVASGKNVLDITNSSIVGDYVHGVTYDFNLNNTAQAQKIIFVDFEATPEKLYRRYYDKKLSKIFKPSDNFISAIPDRLTSVDNLLFIEVIEELIIKTSAKVVIIDNISAISQENEKSSNAAKLMNKIKDMQRKNNLTVLILAHTPKIVRGQPILDIHLAGSSNLYNLAENVFAIGETEQSDDLRYLKQLKSRYSEIHYHKDNVIAMKFKIRDTDGFRGFCFVDYESEEALLKIIDKSTKSNINNDIINAVHYGFDEKGDNVTPGSIAKELYEKYNLEDDVKFETFRARIRQQYNRLKNKGMFNFDSVGDQSVGNVNANEKIKSETTYSLNVNEGFKKAINDVIEEKKMSERNMVSNHVPPTETIASDEPVRKYTEEELDNYEDIPLLNS